jgi:O-antigen/teichoic acid export membrane protein
VVKAISEYVNPRVRAPHLVAYKATADVVSKTVTLIVTIAAARVLAPDVFGVLALAMTTGWLLGVASDAGLPLYLARAVARDAGATGVAVREVMRWRVRLGAAALALGLVTAAQFAPTGYVIAFALIVAAQLAGAVLETLAHVFRGLGRSEIESTITIAQRLAAALLAATVLLWRPSLLLVATALLIPPVIAVCVAFAIALRIAGPAAFTGVNSKLTLTRFRREAAPIGLGVLVSAVYFRCDVYFVNYWHGLDTVGIYNAVFRLVEALRLFPAAVLAVAFPDLVRAATGRPLTRLSVLLLSVGTLAAAVTIAAASGIVHVAYGEAYAAAAAPLQVLALALPLFFLNYALTHQVIAWDGQRRFLAITVAGLVANVAGNLLLIPGQGMLGAAWSTVFTECVITAGCLHTLRRPAAETGSRLAPAEELAKSRAALLEGDAP